MAPVRDLKADFAGLVTAPGLLVRANGACTTLLNLHCDAPGVLRKRRGWSRISADGISGKPKKMFGGPLLGSTVIAHAGTGVAATNLQYGDGSAPFSTVAVVDVTEGGTDNTLTRTLSERMQWAQQREALYFTADEGVLRAYALNATCRFAGMPRGLQPCIYWASFFTPAVDPIVAGTALADGAARAYRVTWHLKNSDGSELGGAPTGRLVVRNITGQRGYSNTTAAVLLTIPLPIELSTASKKITTDWFFRVWATRTWTAATQQGDDECYLLAERYVTSSEITAGYAQYTDNTPDSYLTGQAVLNTNVNNFGPFEVGLEQGVENEDAPPPQARALALWRDCMWYGDIKFRPRLAIRLLSAPSNNDTVTITSPDGGTDVYTFKTVLTGAANEVSIISGFTNALHDLEAIACMLCDAINMNAQTAGTGVYAYYVSVGSQTPGLIYIEQTVTSDQPSYGTIVQFASSNTAIWSPLVSGVANGSTDAAINGLMFSKAMRADSVPVVNSMAIGAADSQIYKLVPFRERLLVFTSTGIYQVTGRTFADFAVSAFDLGFRLLVPESVVTCDEKVYAWCYEGIIEVDDGGVRVISTPIEPTLQATILAIGTRAGTGWTGGMQAMARSGWAIAHTAQHRVMFWTPGIDDATKDGSYEWFAWDTRTRTWSRNALSSSSQTRTCGAIRADDRMVLSNFPTSTGVLFLERLAFAAADYDDTDDGGTSRAITSTATFDYFIPEPDGAAHFQQLALLYSVEQAWEATPTALTLGFTAEMTSAAGVALAPTASSQLSRIETPMAVRRSNRLALTVTHAVVSEYFGMVGLTLTARVGSRFARRGA